VVWFEYTRELIEIPIKELGRSSDTVKSPGQDGGLPEFFHDGHDSSLLPWHRYLLAMWEDAIVEECGWHLGLPCELSN
jgi:hypothetical protein